MKVSRFIASRLSFKGRTATVCVAVSFLVIVIAVAVASGYRREIRSGVSGISGDVQLTSSALDFLSEDNPVSSEPSYYDQLASIKGIEKIDPVIYRAGIIKAGDNIHGVLFKGVSSLELESMQVRIPSRLSDILGISEGDTMLAYFVGEKVKARKFKVVSSYESVLESSGNLVVYVPLEDLRRLNGWKEGEVSALEITLSPEYEVPEMLQRKSDEIGTLTLLSAADDDDSLLATSVIENYPQLFDWLSLIDLNVVMVLVLMTIVAGFNMISGLLILLFRSISTIGILKAMGMSDKGISSVFLRVSSGVVLKGMAVGNLLGFALCLIQQHTHVLKLNPANYFVPYVPVYLNIPRFLAADVLAYAVILLLLLLPAMFISKVDPAVTVRSQ